MHPRKLLSLVVLFILLAIVPTYAAPKGSQPQPLPTLRTKSGKVYKLGCLPTPKSVLAHSKRYVSKALHPKLPSAVDFSAAMPPVGDQGSQGSCTAWATTYYAKSYYEAQEQGWSLNNTSHQYSPAWTYNQINWGYDGGSYIADAMFLLATKGATTMAQQPYTDGDCTTWPTPAQYLQAMPARTNDFAYIFEYGGSRTTAVEDMKELLAAGHPVMLSLPIYSDFSDVGPPNYLYDGPDSEAYYRGGHALCVVGYSDTIGGIGGFKIRNSWATDWGDEGSCYISYNFINNYAWEAWAMTDRIGYTPTAWSHLQIQHTWRRDLTITMGVGSTGTPDWGVIVYENQGGSGNDVDCYVDVSDYGSIAGNWWVKVADDADGDTGRLNTFSLVQGGTEILSDDTPLDINDNSSVIAYLEWAINTFVLRARTGEGGTPLSSTNYVTVNYSSYGQPASVRLWTNHDATVEADAGSGFAFSAASSASGATERWAMEAPGAVGVTASKAPVLLERTYYHQLHKVLGAHTKRPPLLAPDNYAPVTYRNCGAAATAHAYDGIPASEAVWADRGSEYSYGRHSSLSGPAERWSSDATYTGVVEDNEPATASYWHQIRPTITLAGTDAEHTTQLLARTLFDKTVLRRTLHTTWSDWVDGGTELRICDYTTGSPRRSTSDTTSWDVTEQLVATCNYMTYFTVSGYVRDRALQGVPEVEVAVGETITTTDANGRYEASNLDAGTFLVRPSKMDYSFTPASAIATVNATTGDARAVNFTAVQVPRVVWWSPRGSGILPTAEIVVEFDRPMHAPSAQRAFGLYEMYTGGEEYLLPPGQFSWQNENQRLVVIPAHRLKAYRSYRVVIGAAAKSADGAPLEADFEWTFQTADALSVVEYGPTSSKAALGTAIVLAFDRDVDMASVENAFEMMPRTPGHMTFPTARQARFVPDAPLYVAMDYTVHLGANARGLDGVKLVEPFSFNFRTEGPGQVTSVTPTGSGVPLNTPVVVTFAQAMNRASAQAAFSLRLYSLEATIPGSFSWNAESTVMTFQPRNWLLKSKRYEVRINESALSSRGTPLEAFFSYFRTMESLQVLSFSPQGTGASTRPTIRLRFDRLVDPSSFHLSLSPAVPFVVEWVDDSNVAVTIRDGYALALSTPYTVTLGGNLQAADSDLTLGADFTWTFTTHGLVRVVNYSPRGTGVRPNAYVRITFDQAMDAASFVQRPGMLQAPFALWVEMPERRLISGSLRWEDGGKTLIFTPTQRLSSFADYRVIVQKSVLSCDGTQLQQRLEFMFQTAHFLQVVAYSPTGRNVPVDSRITIGLDQDVNRTSLLNNFSIAPAVDGRFGWSTDRQVHFIPTEPLAPGQVYTVCLGPGTRSTDEILLLSAFSWEFTTAGSPASAVASAASAQQTGAGAVAISYTLSAPGEVEIRVLNLAGRTVAVPQAASMSTQGQNTVLWNGRSLTGVRVPAGAYFVEIVACSEDGTRSNLMAPLQIR